MASILTITDNLEPWLSSYKFAAPKKDEKLTLFDQIILGFKLEALKSVNVTCDNNNNNIINNNNNNNSMYPQQIESYHTCALQNMVV